MIPAPKFAVGEVVMVRSEAFPEQNCDNATVIRSLNKRWTCSDSGDQIYTWSYWTDKDYNYRPWRESALRKRPDPSTQSFDEIMQELKTPKVPT